MSQTSMCIATFKNVACRMPPTASILIRGDHGIGKSAVIRQIGWTLRRQLLKKGIISCLDEFPVIDKRLSQQTEGDLIGLPSTDNECTRFNPPDWYKLACRVPCLLFFDELNRATREVMQAAFQIILDRELNGCKLHPETRVFSAINMNARYSVNEMDPALLDRFYAIDLNPSIEEFCDWALNTDPEQGGNLNPLIPAFIKSTNKQSTGDSWLLPPRNAAPDDIVPSPRAWEFLDRATKCAGVEDKPGDEVFYHICMGYIGVEGAIAYKAYCMSVDNRISGEELVNEYHEPHVQAKIKRLGQGHQNTVVDQVYEFIITKLDTVSEQQGKNICALMKDLVDELKISLWCKITKHGLDKVELSRAIHEHCGKVILDVFEVPMGAAGVGIVPNIPGMFAPPPPAKK